MIVALVLLVICAGRLEDCVGDEGMKEGKRRDGGFEDWLKVIGCEGDKRGRFRGQRSFGDVRFRK